MPDIVDEAMWGLKPCWLQDSDGGVGFDAERGHFIESRSDPNFIELLNETQFKRPMQSTHRAPSSLLLSQQPPLDYSAGLGKEILRTALGLGHSSLHWAQANGASEYVDHCTWAMQNS